MGILVSPTGNWTHVRCIARWILNHRTTREVPAVCYKISSPLGYKLWAGGWFGFVHSLLPPQHLGQEVLGQSVRVGWRQTWRSLASSFERGNEDANYPLTSKRLLFTSLLFLPLSLERLAFGSSGHSLPLLLLTAFCWLPNLALCDLQCTFHSLSKGPGAALLPTQLLQPPHGPPCLHHTYCGPGQIHLLPGELPLAQEMAEVLWCLQDKVQVTHAGTGALHSKLRLTSSAWPFLGTCHFGGASLKLGILGVAVLLLFRYGRNRPSRGSKFRVG